MQDLIVTISVPLGSHQNMSCSRSGGVTQSIHLALLSMCQWCWLTAVGSVSEEAHKADQGEFLGNN